MATRKLKPPAKVRDEQAEFEERVWYESTSSGQRGYLVEEDGQMFIRYDRVGHAPQVPFNKSKWRLVKEPERQLNPSQVGQIVYENDRVVCRLIGIYEPRRGDWQSMSHDEQQGWFDADTPPSTVREKIRISAYIHLHDGLKRFLNT